MGLEGPAGGRRAREVQLLLPSRCDRAGRQAQDHEDHTRGAAGGLRAQAEARQDSGSDAHIREARRGRIPLAPRRLGGRHRGGPQAGARLVTLDDRGSGFLAGGRNASHTKADVASAQVAALAGQPCETITVDRGKEFAETPRSPRPRGARVLRAASPPPAAGRETNEITNGLVREYFPKGTDFALAGDDEVAAVYVALNRRPRKRLGFRTPLEVHRSKMLHLL